MSPFRPSRERRGSDPYVAAKTILFVVGSAVGLAGILLDNGWLVGLAIGVLAAGVVLRALARRKD